MKLFGELEAALRAQVDIDKRDVWVQILVKPKRLSAIGCHTDDADTRTCEKRARSVAEISAVINDQTAHGATRGRTPDQRRRSWMTLHPGYLELCEGSYQESAFMVGITDLPG